MITILFGELIDNWRYHCGLDRQEMIIIRRNEN